MAHAARLTGPVVTVIRLPREICANTAERVLRAWQLLGADLIFRLYPTLATAKAAGRARLD